MKFGFQKRLTGSEAFALREIHLIDFRISIFDSFCSHNVEGVAFMHFIYSEVV